MPASKKRLAGSASPKAKSPASAIAKPAVRIFISYCHADDDARKRLVTHLKPLLVDGVSAWWDEAIEAGEPLDASIRHEQKRAHIFVALLSSSYFASDYCWKKEYPYADKQRERGTVRVVGVIVKPCIWTRTVTAGFKLLPRRGRPPERWSSNDAAYTNVAEGVAEVIDTVRRKLATAKPPRTTSKPKLPKPKSVSPATKVTPPKRGGAKSVRTPPKASKSKRQV